MSDVQEWPYERENDPHPFSSWVNLSDVSGEFILKPYHIVDAMLWPASTGRVWLSHIIVSGQSVEVRISDSTGVLCSAIVALSSHVDVVDLLDSFGRVVGFLELGQATIASWADHPVGEYRFRFGATEFSASSIAPRPDSSPVSFLADDGNVVSGPVYLMGGEGVSLGVQDNSITVNVVGDAYYRRDTCKDNGLLGLALSPVRRINWVDKTSGDTGTVSPRRGVITTRAFSSTPEARGFTSPGPDGSVLRHWHRE